MPGQYKSNRMRPLAGGINYSRNPVTLRDGEAADALNVDLDDESVKNVNNGSIKFNNQVAPKSCVRTRGNTGPSPLSVLANQSVPVRGYVYVPYNDKQDIGGDFAVVDNGGTDEFHIRQGGSFDLKVTVRIPEDERLFDAPTRGASSSSAAAVWAKWYGFDEALDDCTIFAQKGGDRLTPMSWALGMTNVGETYATLTGGSLRKSPSTYALTFMWYDAPQWGITNPDNFKYRLTDGDVKAGGEFGTMAYRAIIARHFFEPGRTYHISVSVRVDSGDPGSGTTPVTAWSDDGFVKITVVEEYSLENRAGAKNVFTYTPGGGATNLFVWKGPDDSLEYLSKYGLRCSGKDAMFLGLGQRFAPWKDLGFIPFGSDAAPIEQGGYLMVDRTDKTVNGVGGIYENASAAHNFTISHAGANDYIEISHRGASIGNNGGASPSNGGIVWQGLVGPAPGFTQYNSEALKGYRLVLTGDAPASEKGMVINIGDYSEAVTFEFNLPAGAGTGFPTITSEPALIQCFRWNQRDLFISEFCVYGDSRNYEDTTDGNQDNLVFHARTSPLRQVGLLDLAGGESINNQTGETLENEQSLRGHWPLSDAGGGVCKESIFGNDAFLCPFGLGVSERGERGKNLLFLSGEGESLYIDLADSPILQREVIQALQSGEMGVAVEITFRSTEAYYSAAEAPVLAANGPEFTEAGYGGDANTIIQPFGPPLISWDIQDPSGADFAITPRPFLTLTHRLAANPVNTAPTEPLGFQLEINRGSDQEDSRISVAVSGFDTAAPAQPRWGPNAEWVGKTVTLQIGIEPTATEDEYNIYLSGRPKQALFREDGDPSDTEFAYFSSSVRIEKKDLLQSVITIGGKWQLADTLGTAINPNLGYSEMNWRGLVDEVRVFGTVPSGDLPASSGATVATGKIKGGKALPVRSLEAEDILRPLGEAVETANVVEGDGTVTAPGQNRFFTDDPEDNIDSVKGSYLVVAGDDFEVKEEETLGELVAEFYRVDSVASDGSTLELNTPFGASTRDNASARSFRLLAYTDFRSIPGGVTIEDRPLTLGQGSTFQPGTTTTEDATITSDYFFSPTPVGVNWKLRVYSPLTFASGAEVLPKWSRGISAPRYNPCLGAERINTRKLAAFQGCLYEADDRWRTRGPTAEIAKSFHFKGTLDRKTNVSYPLHNDWVEFEDPTDIFFDGNNLPPLVSLDPGKRSLLFDCWVLLDDVGGIQTIAWVGDAGSDPQKDVGAAPNHIFQYWIRINEGKPEFVIGSPQNSNSSGGTAPPDRGFYIATSDQAITAGEWVHIRWTFGNDFQPANGGPLENWVYIPNLNINGRSTTVQINDYETGRPLAIPNGWVDMELLEDFSSDDALLVLGAAHDTVDFQETVPAYESGTVSGQQLRPARNTGFIHSLRGRMAGFVVSREHENFPNERLDFNPHGFVYGAGPPGGPAPADLGPRMAVFYDGPNDGRGHRVKDTGNNDLLGTIYSHPFISLFHEMGRTDHPVSFSSFGNEVFVANGGRVVVEEEGEGRFAGVLAPTTKPSFTIKRLPLWKENVFVAAGDPDNGPVEEAPDAQEDRFNHYQSFGNNYLLQAYDAQMAWEEDDVLAFKCLIRMASTAGRVVLWSMRDTTNSGRAIEIRDGKVSFVWWDSLAKNENRIETSVPVIIPGFVHYLFFRKRFPHNDPEEGNWVNSLFAQTRRKTIAITGWNDTPFEPGETISGGGGTGTVVRSYDEDTTANTLYVDYIWTSAPTPLSGALTGATSGGTGTAGAIDNTANDSLVVRRFMKEAPNGADTDYQNYPTFFAKADGSTRNAISFTTDDVRPSAGTFTATGLVTVETETYSVGAATDRVQADAINPFHDDMLGMYFQYDDGTTSPLYRIVTVNSDTEVTLRLASDNSTPNFTGLAAANGGVFTGIGLVKSTNFDASNAPDLSVYDISYMGEAVQANPTSGISPFRGETWSPGWVSTNVYSISEAGTPDVFEDGSAVSDPIEVGTDDFAGDIYLTTPPGPLEYTVAGQQFTVLDARVNATKTEYSTSQPNEDLEVTQDVFASSEARSLFWQQLEDIRLLDGVRRVHVTFYDPVNNLESNPSDTLLIVPTGEDRSNPSATARILLTDLPVSNDERLYRRVYITAIDGATPFRVAEIPDNTSSSVSIFKSEREIAQGAVLRFDRTAPPRCKIVAQSQASMFYGNIDGAPDAAIYSQPFEPHNVPLQNTFVLDTGGDSGITGMQDLKGKMIAMKLNAVWDVIVEPGAAITRLLTTGSGCVSQNSIRSLDNRLYWAAPRGIMLFGGTGTPIYVSPKLEPYFRDTIDPRHLPRIHAAINRDRNQYVFTVKRIDDRYTHERIGIEFDHELAGTVQGLRNPALHRITRYQDPSCTALMEVDDEAGGPRKLVGLTEEGFAVWMDEPTVFAARGTDTEIWGDTSASGTTPGASNFPARFPLAGTPSLDRSLEGIRGERVRWINSGAELVGVAVYAEASAIVIDLDPAATPDDGSLFVVGNRLFAWISKHWDFDTPDLSKKAYFLDITRAAGGAGSLNVGLRKDLAATNLFSRVLDLTKTTGELGIGELQNWQYIQVAMSSVSTEVPEFEVLDIAVRWIETEAK
jgi:hypothetical protein